MQFRRPQFVVLSAFLASVCNGLVITIVPLLAKEHLDATPGWLGLYGTSWAVPYIFAAWFAGSLSDRWGRRRSILAAFAVLLAAYALVPFCINQYLLLLPLILVGVGQGTFWPVIEAAMSDGQRPSQIKRAAGFFNFSWMGGLIAGPTLASILYSLNPDAPIVLAVGLIAFLIVIALYPPSMVIVPWRTGAAFTDDEKISRDRRSLFIALAFIGNITTFFMMSSFRSLLVEYTNAHGITGLDYGLLQGALTLGMAATNYFLIRWHRWHYSLAFLFFAEGLAIVFLLLFCTLDYYPVLLILAAAIGFPAGVTYFSSIYYGLEQTEQKGSHSGNHEAIIGIGASAGPILGGWVISLSGMSRGHLIFCAAIFGFVIVLQAALVWRRSRSALPPCTPVQPISPDLASAVIYADSEQK